MSHFVMNVVLPAEPEEDDIHDAVLKRAVPYKEIGSDIGPEKIPDENLEWRVWDEDDGELISFETEAEAREAREEIPGNKDPHLSNTQSKWDWFSIGGRFSPYFKLKEGGEGIIGKPGVFGREEEPGELDADVARVGDIDFEQMMENSAERAREEIETIREVVDLPADNVRPGEKFEELYDDRSEAYDMFWAQTPIKKAKNALDRIMTPPETIYEMVTDPEGYIETERRRGIAPYGFIHEDGTWEAKGDMGWWGMSNDHHEQMEWNERAKQIISDLDDDQILVSVDFHI